MEMLLLIPLVAGYSAKQPSGVLRVELDGGAGRYRADVLNRSHLVTATFACTPEQYEYLCAFKRTATANGSLPFDIKLRLDREAIATYLAYFVPAPFGISRMEGRIRWVEVELEVIKPYDAGEAAADAAIISAYETAHGVSS